MKNTSAKPADAHDVLLPEEDARFHEKILHD